MSTEEKALTPSSATESANKGHPDPFKHYLRLKRPCANCPFLKQGAIKLDPNRLPGIKRDLLADDHSSFDCHKVTHSQKGGTFNDDDGEYTPSGNEAMCAGAAAFLWREGRSNMAMRFGLIFGSANREDWETSITLIAD